MLNYHGKWLTISRHAADEMAKLGLDAEGIIRIVEEGKEVRHREKGKMERWLPRGNKIYNVVIAEHPQRVVVIHVGRFSKTKGHMERLG